MEIINQHCISAMNNLKSQAPSSYRAFSRTSNMRHAFRSKSTAVTYYDMVDKFSEFILQHVKVALTKGFDDDSKRVADYKHFFVLPTIRQWVVGFKIIYGALFGPESKSRIITEVFLYSYDKA